MRTRPCVSGARQAAATPKGLGATTPGPLGPGSRPDLVRARAPAAGQPGEQVGGRHPPVHPHPGRCSICLATAPGLLHEESGRVRHWGDRARHRPLVCEAIDMAARRCPYTRRETIFHSDRGCQYASEQLSQRLGRYEIIASTGMTGARWAGARARP